MASGSEGPTAVWAPVVSRRARARRADRLANEHATAVAREALAFAVHCHSDTRRLSDGASYIEHPLEVARLLRDSGCSEVAVIAGLLHDVLRDANVTMADLTARFGADVANIVHAVTDRASDQSYRERKRVLREQVRGAGDDAAHVFAADKISKVRELPDQARRDQERFAATASASRARDRLARYEQLRLEHYRRSLTMLHDVVPRHPLVKRLAVELERCPIAVYDAIVRGATN